MSSYIEMEDGSLLAVMDALRGTCKVDEKTGVITAVVSDSSEDSDKDIIHQGKNKLGAGWLLEHFNKAPVLTWMHNMYVPSLSAPETRAKLAKVDGHQGRVLTLAPAAFDLEDDFAAQIEGKIRRRVLKEWSVGFRGIKVEPRRNDDGSRGRGYEFFEQKLIEVAVVNRGANYNTSTAVKGLLGSPGLAQETQAGDDAEALELKAEVEYLEQRVKDLEALVMASLAEPGSCADEQKVLLDEVNQAKAEALSGIFDRLVAHGTAHD